MRVVALGLGVMLGILGPLLTGAGSIGNVVSIVLSAGWAWAALAFCVGLACASRTESALLAPASLVVAVIAYYTTKLCQGKWLTADIHDVSGQTTYIDWSSFLSFTGYWCVVACVLGCLLGLAGNLARSRRLRGLPFRLVVPFVAIVDTSQRLHFEASRQGPAATTTWAVIRIIAVAGMLLIVAATWRSGRTANVAEG